MGTIGFSTGALSMLRRAGVKAVELSALRAGELSALRAAMAGLDLTGFEYRSVHAPSRFDDEAGVVESLRTFADLGMNIIVHPDAIKDVSLWRSLNGFVCIENMDSRKSTGRTAEELEGVFAELPEARLCFDIGHARQVDPTMVEAFRILARFGDRLAEVHMSEVDSFCEHHAMTLASQIAFKRVAPRLPSSVPVILESVVNNDGIEREAVVARNVLAGDLSNNRPLERS
jgi:sugar phosphate isomerase/epimerase